MIKEISIENLYKHPHNPRKDLGDLTELADSIKENGVLQNLTVVQMDEENYRIIIGHRRAAAAKKAGLTHLPCAVVVMDEPTQMATMLLENLQRSDLSVIEQAEGFQMMFDLGESMEDITKKTGFSESTVRRRVKLLELDRAELNKSMARNTTLEEYEKLSKVSDIQRRNNLLKYIGTSNFEWFYNDAIRFEEKEKRKKELMLVAEEFATRLVDDADTDDLVHVEYYAANNESKIDVPAMIDGDTFYYEVKANGIAIWRQMTEEEIAKKNSADDEEKKEADRQRELEEEMQEAEEAAYKLRKTFAQKYVGKTKDIARLVDELINRIMKDNAFSWNWSKRFYDLLFQVPKKDEEIIEELKNHSHSKLLFSAVYTAFEDSCINGWSDYRREYKKNNRLDELYELLMDLGYEMSDEEIKLRTGEHEAYRKG